MFLKFKSILILIKISILLNFKNTGVGRMQRENEVQHVFLVGAKSLGAYGGYETFVYKLDVYKRQAQRSIWYRLQLPV